MEDTCLINGIVIDKDMAHPQVPFTSLSSQSFQSPPSVCSVVGPWHISVE